MNHILFHNDIDGVFSAAIFLERTGLMKDMDYSLHGLNTSTRGEKFNTMVGNLKGPILIFDYQYNDRADLWIDHHQNDRIGPDPILNDKMCYDNRAKSATGLVAKYLEFKNIGFTDRAINLVKAAEMIDSADYPNVEFIFRDKSPAMIMRAFFDYSFPSEMMFCRCVEVITNCGLDLDKAIKVLNVDASYVDAIEQEASKTKDKIEIFNNVSVLRQKTAYQHPRYAEHYAVNKPYNIRISNENHYEFKISISFNKWSGKRSCIDIGRFCSSNKISKRGGGHYNVGGCVVEKTRLDDLLDSFSVLVEEK